MSFSVPLQPNGTPTRVRRNFDLAGISNITNCSANSKQAEIEARLQEIIKLTGIITVEGKRYYSSIHDLEHQGELGFGSCGHVVKMRHPPSNAIIAVKVITRFHSIYFIHLMMVPLLWYLAANEAIGKSRRE